MELLYNLISRTMIYIPKYIMFLFLSPIRKKIMVFNVNIYYNICARKIKLTTKCDQIYSFKFVNTRVQ